MYATIAITIFFAAVVCFIIVAAVALSATLGDMNDNPWDSPNFD